MLSIVTALKRWWNNMRRRFYGGRFVAVTPTPTPTPTPAPVKIGNPTITSSTLNVGDTATAVHGTYTGTVTGYSGQWYRGVSPIALATALTYIFASADLGLNITYQESASNAGGSSLTGTSNALGPIVSGPALSTPTLAISSALGAAPLVLSVSDADPVVEGLFFQLLISNVLNDTTFLAGNIQQNIIFFVDGVSYATLDEAIGLLTPSGPYSAEVRSARDNDSGTTTVTGFDPRGNAVSFTADVSAWSNVVTDTINVSSAALTAAAGTSMSHLLTVTGGGLIWTVNSGGAEIYSRATVAAANTDFYVEMTVGTIAASGHNVLGVTDNSIDFNGGGSGFFGGGSALPGDPTFNGISLVIDGSIWVAWHANGTSGTFNIPGGANAAAGDVVGLEYNSSTKVVTCYYKHAAGAMVSIGTVTLTSLIPATPYAFAGGKNTNDSATVDFGATTYTLAGPGTQGAPSGSNIYG